MEGQSDARDPPPEVALVATHRLGSRREDHPDRHGPNDLFRQRRRQPVADPPAGKPIGTNDWRQGGVALSIDSLAGDAGHHKGSGDPREGTRRHGTTLYRGGSTSGSA